MPKHVEYEIDDATLEEAERTEQHIWVLIALDPRAGKYQGGVGLMAPEEAARVLGAMKSGKKAFWKLED